MLAAACSGRLTADWRRAIGPTEVSSTDVGEHANMPDIPSTWKYRRLDSLAEAGTAISYGIVLPGPETPDGVPYVRQQDIAGGTVLVDQLRRTTPGIAAKHRRSSLRQGDVLLCIIRNLRVAVVPPGIDEANITQGMVRIRPSADVIGQYLAAYLESPYAQRWMKDRYIGLAMPRINVADARAIPVPLPSYDEQVEIVSRLNSVFTFTDSVERHLSVAATRLDQSSQAVLGKAFRGELSML
jgi:type I restriction enzyme, S subunit